MNKKHFLAGVLLFVVLSTTACRSTALPDESNTAQDQSSTTHEDYTLSVRKKLSIVYDETYTITSQIHTGYYGSKLYQLFSNSASSMVEDSFWLDTFDLETETMERTRFTLDIPEKKSYVLCSMDVINDNLLSLKMYGAGEEDEEASYFLLQTDLKGTICSMLEPFPEESIYSWNSNSGTSGTFSASNGETYIKEWSVDEQTTNLYRYNAESHERELVKAFANEYISGLCITEDDIIYYTNEHSLIRWDMKSNTFDSVFRLRNSGIANHNLIDTILIDSQGEIALCNVYSTPKEACILTEEPIP